MENLLGRSRRARNRIHGLHPQVSSRPPNLSKRHVLNIQIGRKMLSSNPFTAMVNRFWKCGLAKAGGLVRQNVGIYFLSGEFVPQKVSHSWF